MSEAAKDTWGDCDRRKQKSRGVVDYKIIKQKLKSMAEHDEFEKMVVVLAWNLWLRRNSKSHGGSFIDLSVMIRKVREVRHLKNRQKDQLSSQHSLSKMFISCSRLL